MVACKGSGIGRLVEEIADALKAIRLGCNCRDGTVEIVVYGPASLVGEMIEECRRGPAGARVDKLDLQQTGSELLGGSLGFKVLPTV